MTLAEIRQKFVELSGRYDLVTDQQSYEDDGADFFIQAGQRFLENQLDFPHKQARAEVTLAQGESEAKLAGVQSLDRILRHESEGAALLDEVRYPEFYDRFGNQTKRGTPSFWSSPVGRSNPAGGQRQTSGDQHIKLFPAADKEYTFSIIGSFFSQPLENKDDENFWTVVYPETLIQSTMYTAERFYRNRQGMRDHLEAIQRDLTGIDANVAMDEAGEIDQMSGSW